MSLTEKIEKILFEDSWNKYGSEYMSHPYEQEIQPATIQPELPIMPSPMADMQLTDTAPPVDDEAYTPVNNKELANALAALAVKVPDRFVGNLYKQIRNAVIAAEASADVPEGEAEAEVIEQDLEERVLKLASNLLSEISDDQAEYDRYRRGDTEETPDDFYEVPEDEKIPDTIQGKYLAQYWRERPGKDPTKFKGSGESTMVNATGRLLQNVVRPLIDVPKEQLQDAAEYLRLQFRVLSKDRDEIPKDAPRTFSGLYLKKLVPKLSDDQLGQNFLQTVVTDFKRRDDKWLSKLVDSAFAEVESEKAARAKLRATLEKEAPQQADLLDSL